MPCAYCARDLSGERAHVRCAARVCMAADVRLCVGCFVAGAAWAPHEHSHAYSVEERVSAAVFASDWDVGEERRLLDALGKFGPGHWRAVSEAVRTKSQRKCEVHYRAVYLGSACAPLPDYDRVVCAEVGGAGAVPQSPAAGGEERTVKAMARDAGNGVLDGYMPKRGDFDVEWDDGAEDLIADLAIEDDDTEEEKALKLRLVQIYNERLEKRETVKAFLLEHGLLDFAALRAQERRGSRDEKELTARLKLFARLLSARDYTAFENAVLAEYRLSRDAYKVAQNRAAGVRTRAEIDIYEDDRKARVALLQPGKGLASATAAVASTPTPQSFTTAQRENMLSEKNSSAALSPSTCADSTRDSAPAAEIRGNHPAPVADTPPTSLSPSPISVHAALVPSPAAPLTSATCSADDVRAAEAKATLPSARRPRPRRRSTPQQRRASKSPYPIVKAMSVEGLTGVEKLTAGEQHVCAALQIQPTDFILLRDAMLAHARRDLRKGDDCALQCPNGVLAIRARLAPESTDSKGGLPRDENGSHAGCCTGARRASVSSRFYATPPAEVGQCLSPSSDEYAATPGPILEQPKRRQCEENTAQIDPAEQASVTLHPEPEKSLDCNTEANAADARTLVLTGEAVATPETCALANVSVTERPTEVEPATLDRSLSPPAEPQTSEQAKPTEADVQEADEPSYNVVSNVFKAKTSTAPASDVADRAPPRPPSPSQTCPRVLPMSECTLPLPPTSNIAPQPSVVGRTLGSGTVDPGALHTSFDNRLQQGVASEVLAAEHHSPRQSKLSVARSPPVTAPLEVQKFKDMKEKVAVDAVNQFVSTAGCENINCSGSAPPGAASKETDEEESRSNRDILAAETPGTLAPTSTIVDPDTDDKARGRHGKALSIVSPAAPAKRQTRSSRHLQQDAEARAEAVNETRYSIRTRVSQWSAGKRRGRIEVEFDSDEKDVAAADSDGPGQKGESGSGDEAARRTPSLRSRAARSKAADAPSRKSQRLQKRSRPKGMEEPEELRSPKRVKTGSEAAAAPAEIKAPKRKQVPKRERIATPVSSKMSPPVLRSQDKRYKLRRRR